MSLQWYPCIYDEKTCRISKKVGGLMTMEEAEQILKTQYRQKWLMCEAIPQREDHPHFQPGGCAYE